MLSQRLANIVFISVILVACAYFAWMAEGFVTSGLLASSGLPSKFFPQLLLGLTAICCVIVGLSYVRLGGAGGDNGETVFNDATEARQGILMLAVAVVCYVVWLNFGFLPMAVVMGPLSLMAMNVRKPLYYIAVWVLTAFVWAVFTYGLKIQLV